MIDSNAPVRRRMLVIEDDVSVSEGIRAYFEDYEYTVDVAGDGNAGLERFRARSTDVVLVDLHIPGVDSLEVLHDVRKDAPETPVMVVSGSGTLRDVVQALRLGAWDYLLKPIADLSILRYAVQRSLERTELLRENRMHREHLEDEIRKRTAELQLAHEALERKNVAMREVLAAVEQEKASVGRNVTENIERSVLPELHALGHGLNAAQHQRLKHIETSLREIASPFVNNLSRDAASLTPTELRVSTLIRRGLSAKEIAAVESVSVETVSTHRRSIRRKLGITKQQSQPGELSRQLLQQAEGHQERVRSRAHEIGAPSAAPPARSLPARRRVR